MEEAAEEPSEELFRFGLVCVHGIGAQSQGSTADSVVQVIQSGVEKLGGTTDTLPAADCGDCVMRQMVVSLPNIDAFELHIYDAWWDRLVEPPALGTVMRWLIKIGPLVATALVGALAMELEQLREQRRPNHNSDHPPAMLGLPMLISTVITPLLYLLFPLIVIICALPKKGQFLRDVFTNVLGDAWLYKSGECENKVIPYLETILKRADSNSNVVVLLGHSQGAELSRRAAIESEVQIGACAWIGSGRFPLTFLRVIDWSRWYGPLMWLHSVVFPLLFTWFMQRILAMTILMLMSLLTMAFDLQSLAEGRVPEGSDWSAFKELMNVLLWSIPSFIAMSVVPLIIVFAGRGSSRVPSDIEIDPSCTVMAIKSPLDPVSFGVEENAVVRYIPPRRNPATWISEHTSYFQKAETGLALLELLWGSELIEYDKYEPKPRWWMKTLSVAAFIVLLAVYLTVGTLEIRLLLHVFQIA
ncbi:hypothetical protein [Mycobacteroides abscessus]|uniref:hypothetical protein n=1 Tax=Mycobacteroides abscessus TaxID=36809 RepID=UPI0002683224|nr:hypothetical protein [Mycobacteroides abscessus]EIU18379.1 hypothetical protein MA5S0422_1131 [Mycobacteroides abscessus 5S-0422]EIU19850.1 hypothetical protein MA5S0708_2447 [Mycobacteroides abscessus 5S-0708]MDO2968608.1 hypothetical protein [Mycobacteroides abscessus subsp. bolletii]MDO3081127.1 hypothetical protein [Mycobacteroides abscessus subsp. bolletii]SLC01146.1 Uncharacterised protein [Mycobacteroides abscessus subsp. bolletii]